MINETAKRLFLKENRCVYLFVDAEYTGKYSVLPRPLMYGILVSAVSAEICLVYLVVLVVLLYLSSLFEKTASLMFAL